MKYKKGLILFCVITMLFTSIAYAGVIEEIIGKSRIISTQRQQREPVELELKGNKQIIYVYITYVTSIIREKKPKPPKPPKP